MLTKGRRTLQYSSKIFSETQVRSVVENLRFFVFLDVNPDGKHYSQTVLRCGVKTGTEIQRSIPIEVMLDRKEASLRLGCLDTEESWPGGTKPVT